MHLRPRFSSRVARRSAWALGATIWVLVLAPEVLSAQTRQAKPPAVERAAGSAAQPARDAAAPDAMRVRIRGSALTLRDPKPAPAHGAKPGGATRSQGPLTDLRPPWPATPAAEPFPPSLPEADTTRVRTLLERPAPPPDVTASPADTPSAQRLLRILEAHASAQQRRLGTNR
jgi:hypothetical protein